MNRPTWPFVAQDQRDWYPTPPATANHTQPIIEAEIVNRQEPPPPQEPTVPIHTQTQQDTPPSEAEPILAKETGNKQRGNALGNMAMLLLLMMSMQPQNKAQGSGYLFGENQSQSAVPLVPGGSRLNMADMLGIINATRDSDMGTTGMLMGLMMSQRMGAGKATKIMRNMHDPWKLLGTLTGTSSIMGMFSGHGQNDDDDEDEPAGAASEGMPDLSSMMGLMQLVQSFQPASSTQTQSTPQQESSSKRALHALSSLLGVV